MAHISDLTEKAANFVKTHVSLRFPDTLRYHTFDHFTDVVKAARELADATGLSAADAEVLELAAWFHDCGYHLGAEGHEERSVEIATEFLRMENADPNTAERVTAVIRATRDGAPANDELQRLIKDADLMHCSRPDYQERMESLREERENTEGVKIKKKAWMKENILFMEEHPYLSAAARKLWSEGRERNISDLKAALEEREAKKAKEPEYTVKEQPAQVVVMEVDKKALKERQKEIDKAVETMFKITLTNHTRLSAIADRKANIMLSVSSLIISVVIARFLTKIDFLGDMIFPTGILMLTCAAAIITATLATRPKVTRGTTAREDIEQRKANLLFFGNFHSMSMKDFEWGMQEVMTNKDYLYSSMVKDLYFLGKVLHRKYVYLNLTYTIFAAGVLLSLVAAVVVAVMGTASRLPQ